MSLVTISDVWNAIKPNIDLADMNQVVDALLNHLIDEGHSPLEIKQAFKGDRDIKEALDYFLETPEDGLYLDNDDEEHEDYSDDEYEE